MNLQQDWNQHWSQYQQMASMNPAQWYRFQVLLKIFKTRIDPSLKSQKALDVGCGQGDFLFSLRQHFPTLQLSGVDASEESLRLCQGKVSDGSYFLCDLAKPYHGDKVGAFSHAFCIEVMEHVDSPPQLLQNIFQFLAPGGRLLLSVPGGPMSAFDKHIGHQKHFKAQEVQKLLADAGFAEIEVMKAGFPFFNIYKLMTIAAGKRLIQLGSDGGSRTSVGLVSKAFGHLFKLNLRSSPMGWQILAVATKK